MRIALAGLALASMMATAARGSADPRSPGSANPRSPGSANPGSPGGPGADRARPAPPVSKGLSLEQIRGVMRAHAAAFNACLTAATRSGKSLHGPFLYDLEVDKRGKVTAVRPFQPSAVAAFDKCITGVLLRAKFPGGPASVEAPLVFDPS
jgi:hypothetical protein